MKPVVYKITEPKEKANNIAYDTVSKSVFKMVGFRLSSVKLHWGTNSLMIKDSLIEKATT